MISRIFTILVLCSGTLAIISCGSSSQVLNIQDSAIKTTKNSTTINNIHKTITYVCAQKGWEAKSAGSGHIIATKQKRGRKAKVDITFTSESYNINYNDSSNLKYDGTQIDPLYNDWVTELDEAIRERLSSL